jgi:hypothetical protein
MFSTMQNFVINGDNYDSLKKVIDFALAISGDTIKCYRREAEGLMFCDRKITEEVYYPFNPSPELLAEQVKEYIGRLSDEEILAMAGKRPAVDGAVILGWEVFYPLWCETTLTARNSIKNYRDNEVIAVRPSWIVYAK